MQTTTILNHIPRGRENAVTRAQLVTATGLPDREVRRLIQSARDEGALIINDQSGAGYYIAGEGDLQALYNQYMQDTARAMSLLKRRKHIRRILREAGEL